MPKEYAAICDVEYWSDTTNSTAIEHIGITHIATFTDAMALVEEHYGTDLVSVKMTIVEGPVFHFSRTEADRIIQRDNEILSVQDNDDSLQGDINYDIQL
jgi:hypothetical protein